VRLPNRDRLTMRVVLLKRLGPHPELVEVDLILSVSKDEGRFQAFWR
jgi:hypothetical protein